MNTTYATNASKHRFGREFNKYRESIIKLTLSFEMEAIAQFQKWTFALFIVSLERSRTLLKFRFLQSRTMPRNLGLMSCPQRFA